MTMNSQDTGEKLPVPANELEKLATYYDTHDVSAEMETAQWVDPRPMRTTSVRLPAEVIDALRTIAEHRGIRYTSLIRQVLETAARTADHEAELDNLQTINERLARIEDALSVRRVS